MSELLVNNKTFQLSDYQDEKELENELENHSKKIFPGNIIYIRIKKRFGKSNKVEPDGYLINLKTTKPEFYIEETELDIHHNIDHISNQLIRFSRAFKEDKEKVIEIVTNYLGKNLEIKNRCEDYAKHYGCRNMDDLINQTINKSPFQVVVVIDQDKDELQELLNEELAFKTIVIELKKYESEDGEKVFQYDPFEEEISSITVSKNSSDKKLPDKSKFDTIIVPARKDGFERVFIGENRWWELSISKDMLSQLKYIAAYQVKPIQQITHCAEIKNIEPWNNTSKYVVNFKEAAKKLPQPIDNKFFKGKKVILVRSALYAEYSKLINSKTLKDVLG